MAGALDTAMGFSKSIRRTFHDVPYVLAISGDGEGLAIEVEHAEDGRRWRSKFPTRFIEEITQRTGNAKKFDIFVRMLLSALAQESEAVYLDVLTARDLEMLRRHANPQGPPTTSTAGQSDKRYLILTYRAEFDKVHYPLPLPLEERSEEDTLRALVVRLRAELAEARQEKPVPAPLPPREDERVAALQQQSAELGDALRASQREVEALRAEVRSAAAAASRPGAADPVELLRHRDKIKSLQADVKSLADQLKEKEQRFKREADASAREIRTERQKADKLQQQIRKLEEEKQRLLSRPGGAGIRGTSAERSRPASRSPSAERARPPSRPMSGVRQQSTPPQRSRPTSRASSAASSRERTPSPGAFLRSGSNGRRGASPGPRGQGPPPRGASTFQRSSSPGACREGRRGSSPSAYRNQSPYRQAPVHMGAADPPPRRAPSPDQRQGGFGGSGATLGGSGSGGYPTPGGRAPVSLRSNSAAAIGGAPPPGGGLRSSKPGAHRYGSAGPRPAGSAARLAGAAVAGSSSGPAGGRGSRVDSSSERESSQHRPGTLFGLAADLGLGGAGTGSLKGAGVLGGGLAPAAPAVAGAASTDAADAFDIDARLQALQSFLKQTKNISS